MKISSLTGALNLLNQVRTRKEGEGGAGQNGYENLFQKRKGDDAEQQGAPSDEEIQNATQAFSDEGKAQTSGISAQVEGSGPGLRVVLKDVSGRTLRQMTGEKFIKMRESSNADTRKRGKILDQKV